MLSVLAFLFFFFFNDTATTEIYTLSLHDALPIYLGPQRHAGRLAHLDQLGPARLGQAEPLERAEQHGQLVDAELRRSEEHTSELQSQSNLVCRLLLEKKKLNVITQCRPV